MENLNYKNENIERKYFKSMQKNQFLTVKNSLLEFIQLEDREIEELLFKLIIVSIADMDKFEQKEIKKIRHLKNTWYDWLINYIPGSIRRSLGGLKGKILFVCLFYNKHT